MARITISQFGGLFPKISPRLIPDNAATIASYARLDSGRLGAFGQNVDVNDHNGTPFVVPLTTKTIYKHRNRDGSYVWLRWDNEVHVIPSPIREDRWDRLYWSGDGFPRFTIGTAAAAASAPAYVPNATYRLGIPKPDAAPAASVTGQTGDQTAPELFRSYIFSYVSGLGEEGPTSPPSAVFRARQGDTVTVTFTDAFPPFIYSASGNLARRRVYRTNIRGEYQYVADVPIGTNSFVDTLLDEELGEIASSTSNDPPPNEVLTEHPDGPLQMMTLMPNGIVAGYAGRTIFFSEAYLPHAFPREYALTTRYRITGLVSLSIGLLVVTEGKPALVTGSSPASMSMVEIDTVESCVSRRSIVDMGEMAIFAGPDGLVAATESGMRNLTAQLFDNKQWAALNPESIHAYRYDGRYLFFYDNGVKRGGYMLEFTGELPTLVEIPFYAIAGFLDPVGGDLYLAIEEGSFARVRKFDAGPPAAYDWQSKELRVEAPINPGCAIVDAETYPVTFTLYADGVQRYQKVVTDDHMFRLPSGYKAREFRVRLQGTGLVNAVHVAETPQELRP